MVIIVVIMMIVTIMMNNINAEDFRLPTAAFNLVKAVQGLRRKDWRGLLHVTTSPTPRAGKENPEIPLNGLGPVGSHAIPQDVWERTVPPEFYG